ncbi:energy-coupling factor transporter transmembrane protein EcfT [Nocardioides sp. GY 10113]|uniref:CbiQ family ECF transporter T component n=1 Tax=Nocardioides sp. GY 10113 TaxID=2569761 RepID=UPI0010A8BD97|nr:CbiQ family ECF transporter T component [Nocardioides sp. GY 10113]TIC88021.1 energy-coupling factor transporter transmembrane protein EcfT [Nocardioides sp. GY 10113]
MSQILVGAHQPGTTFLHRAPVGPKVVALIAFSVTVVAVRDVVAAFAFLGVALALAAAARIHLATLARATRGVLLIALVASALQWWWYGPAKAVETTVDLVTLALAAVVLTATTPINAMLDAVARWLRPFARLGLNAERVGLALALAIGALPGTLAIARETRDAARARGLGRRPRAYLSPFVIRVVARSIETGDALHARGLGDD